MNDIKRYSTAVKVWALCHRGHVGPRAFLALIARFGSLEAVFDADLETLSAIDGLSEEHALKIYESLAALDEAAAFMAHLDERDILYRTILDTGYPPYLKELNDPPPLLFGRGRFPANDEKLVSVIGSREGTGEGIAVAVELATKLAENDVGLISGLDRGISAAAHLGALQAGGTTYGVIPSGFDDIHPEENRLLAIEMVKKGGIFSEYPPETEWDESCLEARNRLVVGMGQAVIIGEVSGDSTWTVDTAEFCHQLGKIVFISLDGCELPDRDNSAVEDILTFGAIPFHLQDGLEMIIKALV